MRKVTFNEIISFLGDRERELWLLDGLNMIFIFD